MLGAIILYTLESEIYHESCLDMGHNTVRHGNV